MTKPEHLSASQVNTYLTCPLQHFWRYHERLKIPPKSAMTLSKSIHFGIEGNYRQKVKSHKDLSLPEVLDRFSTDFDYRKHETLWQKDEKPPKIKDEGVGLLSVYHKDVAPKVQPSHVEHKFKVTFENFDVPLIGYLDLIAEPGIIIDHKTSAKAPSVMEKETKASLQLTAYSLGYRAKFHKLEKGIRVDVMFRTQPPKKKKQPKATQKPKAIKKPKPPKEPKVLPFPTTRTQHDINRFLKQMAYVAKAIEEELYYPRQPGWQCTPDWCGFYAICHKEW